MTIDRERAEGVYCTWNVDAAPGVALLTIERVNGDASVTTLVCTQDEAGVIAAAIRGGPSGVSVESAKRTKTRS